MLPQLSVASFAAYLHQGRFESDKLITYGHHVSQMASSPHVHVFLQVLQRLIIVAPLTLCCQDFTKGCKFQLQLDGWANICLGVDGHKLNLFFKIFECFLQIFSLCHLTVLGSIVYIFILSFLLHLVEVGQSLRSVRLLLLLRTGSIPNGRLGTHFFLILFLLQFYLP